MDLPVHLPFGKRQGSLPRLSRVEGRHIGAVYCASISQMADGVGDRSWEFLILQCKAQG